MNTVYRIVISLAALFFIQCSAIEVIANQEDKEVPYLSNYKEKCISLVDSCIIALDNTRLCLTTNLGESWIEGPNVPEEEFIRMAFLFEDGTLFFARMKIAIILLIIRMLIGLNI